VELVIELQANQTEIWALSPSVACIVNGRQYQIDVILFADRERAKIVGTHKQGVGFFVPPSMLKVLQIRECRPTGRGGDEPLRGAALQAPESLPYPPAGSPDPGPACKRQVQPNWLQFFCRFMTEKVWISAGSPSFRAADGSAWQPFFDPDSTLIEGLTPIHASEAIPKPRYTPWARFFRQELRCDKHQIINPYVFRYAQARRAQLLGLNWAGLSSDPADPTSSLEDGAMFMLFTLAGLKDTHKERDSAPLHVILFGMASGETTFRPDFQRDGEVALVRPNGTVVPLDDLDVAAKYLRQTVWLATNDVVKTKDASLHEAKLLSSKAGRPLVHIYMAQDLLTLPWSNNTTYQNRLEYLVKRTVALSGGNNKIAAVSHGWSAHLVAAAVIPYPGVMEHISLAPSPGPWHVSEYLDLLRKTKVQTHIAVGQYDFVAFLGGGADPGRSVPTCVGRKEQP
jgi:hypothetical protein